MEGALKKLGVEGDCSATEEEDGYNAESDPEEEVNIFSIYLIKNVAFALLLAQHIIFRQK